MNTIVVLGGGTAGWLSALFFKKNYPNSSVTVIESKEIGIIGVGESATPYIIELLDFLNISVLDILKPSDITFKNGIKFLGWGKKDFFHTFNLNDEFYSKDPALINYYFNDDNVFRKLNPLVKITEKNKISNLKNNLPQYDYSIHFDAFKFSNTLKNIAISRNIIHLQDDVNDVDIKDNKIVSLVLSENKKLKGDFFVDCSGFKRVLSNKFNIKFKKFDELLTDTAIPCPILKTFIEPFTTAKTLNCGWSWKIPTRTRTGNGYVFSREYTTIENAKLELLQHLKTLTDEDVNLNKIIYFEPGVLEKIHFNNVLSVGLASHFLEPLEGTSLAISALILFEFIRDNNNFNDRMINKILQIKNFILLHYLNNKDNNKFWVDARKKALENDFIQKLINDKLDYDIFKDSYNYFSFLNHLNFLQNLGSLNNNYNNFLFKNTYKSDHSHILKNKSWYYNHLRNAIDYKEYYSQFI